MGMYSYIDECEVEIVDLEGLKEYLEEVRKDSRTKHLADAVTIYSHKDHPEISPVLNFEGMDGWKIISYWYEDFVQFIRDLAVFIEGNISFTYETDEEKAIIEFEDGQTTINIGVMKYEACSPEELSAINPMDDWLVARLAARKL